jgi:hypothetical protein
MALANLFPQNNWKADGLLGGMLAAEQNGYGIEQLKDEKRRRDLEDAMKANALEKENLDKPVEASDRDLKLNATNPLARVKSAADMDWVSSGNYTKEKETKLATEEQALSQKKYAQDALERGEWLLEGDGMFKPEENGYLGVNPDAWNEWMQRKPKSVNYIQGSNPTPENIQRIRDAAKNAKMNLDVVRNIATQEPKLKAAEAERDANRSWLSEEKAADRASREAIAEIGAVARTSKVTLQTSFANLAADTADEADIAAVELAEAKNTPKGEGSKYLDLMIALSKGKDLKNMTPQEQAQIQQQALRSSYSPSILALIERNETRLYGAPRVKSLIKPVAPAAAATPATPAAPVQTPTPPVAGTAPPVATPVAPVKPPQGNEKAQAATNALRAAEPVTRQKQLAILNEELEKELVKYTSPDTKPEEKILAEQNIKAIRKEILRAGGAAPLAGGGTVKLKK